MKMVRKQIYIRPDQEKALKQLSEITGVSEAALIRLGIDQLKAGRSLPTDKSAWQKELDFISQRAWEQSRALIKKRLKMDVPQTGRGWTREELYEDRLERFSR